MKQNRKKRCKAGQTLNDRVKEAASDVPDDEARLFLEYMSRDRIRTPSGRETDAPRKRSTHAASAYSRDMMLCIDLEGGRPGSADAVRIMEQRLDSVRTGGKSIVKLIHGYGSSGHGGAIREAVRSRLKEMKACGFINDYISGEDFGAFCEAFRSKPELIGRLNGDSDYGKGNQGITIVVL